MQYTVLYREEHQKSVTIEAKSEDEAESLVMNGKFSGGITDDIEITLVDDVLEE